MLPFAVLFLLASPAFADEAEDNRRRLERLEQELESQRNTYEGRITKLEQEIRELKGDPAESEIDRLIEEANAEADAYLDGGAPRPSGEGFLSPQSLLNAFNPRITVFGDFALRLDNRKVCSTGHDHGHEEEHEDGEHEDGDHEDGEHEEDEHEEEGTRVDDRAYLRSLEIDLRASVDPFAKAVAIIGLHEDLPGEYHVEPEELYVTLETLPWSLRAKVGKFRASMGTVNRLHPHDLPQTTTPLVIEEWFGEEGLVGTGTELSWLAPETFVDSIEVTLGAFQEDHLALASGDSHDPAWLGRVQFFESISDSDFVQIGTSHFFGATDDSGDRHARIHGFDILYRWRSNESPLESSFVAQAEGYYLRRQADEGSTRSLAGFAMLQFQPIRDLYFGVRGDYLEPLDRFDEEKQWSAGVWVSYYTSEFLRFRIGWEHRGFRDERDLDTLWLQLTFVFGSHPVEPYWFNK